MNKGFSTIYLYSTAICCSILLSCWMGFREIVINPDAICYLLSAQTIGTAGIQTAAHLCPQSRWPFYSIFIFELASHLHFSYALSAYLLNGLFSLISVAAFIAIVQSLGGSKRTLWLAAIVILFAHEFNSVRQYIIRDHGFWAFYLASLFFFLRYFRSPNWKTAWCFSGSLFIASLFRIEGVIFLLALPFASWFCFRYPLKQRALMFLTLHVPTLMVCLLGLIWLLWHASSVDHLGRVSEVIEQFQHGVTLISQQYQSAKASLSHGMLASDANELDLVLSLLLIVWYGVSVLGNVSWPYAFLVLYAWCFLAKNENSHLRQGRFALFAYLLINIVITFGFLLEHFFLSKRYLIALSLILMVWVPFALDNLVGRWREKQAKLWLISLVPFVLISAAGGMIDFGYSKSYLRDAGEWMAKHVPLHASLYVNDYQLSYYSAHFGNELFSLLPAYVDLDAIAGGKWKQFDYLALRLPKTPEDKTASILQQIPLQPIQEFKNKRGDQVRIYKVTASKAALN